MKEYAVLKITTSHITNADFLNKKAKEGWDLINVVSIPTSPGEQPVIHAYMSRENDKDKSPVLMG